MIEIADKLANANGVGDICEFVVGGFPEAINIDEGPFDACTGNGFFDYIEHPVPIITRMRELTEGKLIMSFPKAVEWRVPLRRLRFWLKGTPLVPVQRSLRFANPRQIRRDGLRIYSSRPRLHGSGRCLETLRNSASSSAYSAIKSS